MPMRSQDSIGRAGISRACARPPAPMGPQERHRMKAPHFCLFEPLRHLDRLLQQYRNPFR
jgi:hypothetical protein